MATSNKSYFSNSSGTVLQNSGDIVSYSLYILITTVSNNFIGVIISLVGIPTNAVNCLIFRRQGLRDRTNLCLFSLALVDLLGFVHTLTPTSVKFFIDIWNKSLGNEFVFKALAYTLGVLYGWRATSDVISMIIAVDRCLCVLLPLHVTHLIRTRTMAAMMAASFVFLQLCYVVLPLKFTVARLYANNTRTFEWRTVQTEIGLKYGNILDAVSNTALGIALPIMTFIVVSAATAMTVVKLRSAARWREKTSSSNIATSDRQTGATKMLVLVSCLYIVTMTPYVASVIVRILVEDFSPYGRYYYSYTSVTSVVEKIAWINNALNFFVYFAQSSRFRRELREILCCGHREHVTRVNVTHSLTQSVSL